MFNDNKRQGDGGLLTPATALRSDERRGANSEKHIPLNAKLAENLP